MVQIPPPLFIIKIENKIEYAKSYFVLSQLLIILAGFLFASSGIAYSSSFNNFDKAVDLKLSSMDNSTLNLTSGLIQVYGDLTQNTFSLYRLFIVGGFVVAILSLVSWCIGNRKLSKN